MDDEEFEAAPGITGGDGDPELAAAAHEIRAPLLAVKAALESVLAGGEGVNTRRLLEGSLAEVEDLAVRMEEILRSALGSGGFHRRPTDVVALVADVVRRGTLDPAGEVLVLNSPDPIMAEIDAGRLRIAIANLIRNAVTYGTPDTKVEVAVEETEGGWVQISVRNQGAMSWSPKAESPFAAGTRDDPSGRNPAGRGLGLFLARRMAEEHGGRLWVETSESQTTFFLRLERLPS